MTWRTYLQSRTRNPTFLWRMVIAILLSGVAVGLVVDWYTPAWIQPEPLEQEEKDPEPVPHFGDWQRLEQLADRGEWAEVWRLIPGYMVESWRQVGVTALAVLTGACWLAFALQAIQPRTLSDGRAVAAVVGVAMGVVSIWPTIFLILWQERRWGLVESEQLAASVKFYVLGVGLREELSKLVCFLPLLPWFVRRRDELGAMMAAACVGIGFGMEENVSYIYASAGSGGLTRLLTPVPAHMALAGLVGLAAYRACRWPRDWAPQFVAMFGVAVLGHGLFDVLVGYPDGMYFAVAIFVLLQRQFFRELRPKQALRIEPISLTANFLFCVSVVAAATFIYVAAAAGWKLAGDALVAGTLGQAVVVYLFLCEMPETIVKV